MKYELKLVKRHCEKKQKRRTTFQIYSAKKENNKIRKVANAKRNRIPNVNDETDCKRKK